MGRVRNSVANTALLVASTAVALLGGELLSRLALDPVDYLRPRLIPDPVLRHRVEPGSGGHDEWGFRNASVPSAVDIVAIGDSQTYGLSATSHDAWPSQLSRLSGRTVYNMALGGYGPVQYYYLLREKAPALHPALVVVGLYWGNDTAEAFSAAYFMDYWASFRDMGFVAVHDSISASRVAMRRAAASAPATNRPGTPAAEHATTAVRTWLTYHSVLYRFVFEASPLGEVLRTRVPHGVADSLVTDVYVRGSKIHTQLAAPLRRGAVDLEDPQVREGVKVTIEAFRRMKAAADSEGVALLVAIIPSKERVYRRFLDDTKATPHLGAIEEIAANEHAINERVKAALASMGMDYVDTTPALQEAARTTRIYPGNWNSHPNAAGYGVIARAIYEHISTGYLPE